MVSRRSQPTTLREQRSNQVSRCSQPPPCLGKYLMSPTHAWFGMVGASWLSKRLDAARTAGFGSVVMGTKARGCWAHKPRVFSARRMRQQSNSCLRRALPPADGACRSAARASQTLVVRSVAIPVRARVVESAAATRGRRSGPRAKLDRAGARAMCSSTLTGSAGRI